MSYRDELSLEQMLKALIADVMGEERQKIVQGVVSAMSDIEQERISAAKATGEKYTREEAAKELRVSIGTIDNWIRSGALGSEKAGRRVLISKRDLDDYTRKHL